MIKQKRDLHDTDRGDVMYAIGCLCGLIVTQCCLVITCQGKESMPLTMS